MNNDDFHVDTEDEEADKIVGDMSFTFGLIFLAAGLVLAALFMGWPIYRAWTHAPEFRVSTKGSLSAVLLIVLALLAFFKVDLIKDPQKISLRDLSLLAVLTGVSLAAWWGFKVYIESLGYEFSNW